MKIKNDIPNSKFVAQIDHDEAIIEYKRGPENSYNLIHTHVPSELQGKGIANELVQAAIQIAKDENVKVIATCPYVRRWFEKHPEETDLLIR